MVAVNLFLSMASLSYVKTSAPDMGEMYMRVMLAVKTTVRSASHCWREQLLGFMMSFLQFSVRLVTITFGGLTVDTFRLNKVLLNCGQSANTVYHILFENPVNKSRSFLP